MIEELLAWPEGQRIATALLSSPERSNQGASIAWVSLAQRIELAIIHGELELSREPLLGLFARLLAYLRQLWQQWFDEQPDADPSARACIEIALSIDDPSLISTDADVCFHDGENEQRARIGASHAERVCLFHFMPIRRNTRYSLDYEPRDGSSPSPIFSEQELDEYIDAIGRATAPLGPIVCASLPLRPVEEPSGPSEDYGPSAPEDLHPLVELDGELLEELDLGVDP